LNQTCQTKHSLNMMLTLNMMCSAARDSNKQADRATTRAQVGVQGQQ
jgi:hypothetical protein